MLEKINFGTVSQIAAQIVWAFSALLIASYIAVDNWPSFVVATLLIIGLGQLILLSDHWPKDWRSPLYMVIVGAVLVGVAILLEPYNLSNQAM